ncbi:uncharacterized protein TNCV_2431471 [Trichonephila clavipes]|nr:uncharacterized protein TNCV_2431471 [Trichonephila clavipes]
MLRKVHFLMSKDTFAPRNDKPSPPKDQTEIKPVVNHKEKPVVTGDTYTKDASGKSIYPLDSNGNEIAFTKQGTGGRHYATDEKNNAYYPKNKFGGEVVFGDYILNKDGTIKFPLNREGDPKYEKDNHTNDQVYFTKKDGSINWGVDKHGNQRYAKRKNGDEYYPETGEFARNHSGSPQYARTRYGKVIFPLDVEFNESYIKDDTNGDSHVIYIGDDLLHRYAKTKNGEEIYPIEITNQATRRYKEIILNGKYAKTNVQEAKYPLDEYGNEYTLEIPIHIAGKEKDYFPRGYPITNDNWVIVPEVDGKEFISDQLLPKVQINNIIGKLYREGKNYRDYVTNRKSTRLSRAARQTYSTLPYVLGANNSPQKNPLKRPPIPLNNRLPKISQQLNWPVIAIAILVVLAFVYLVYKFFFRKNLEH